MEAVLAVYKGSYGETPPLICMGESSKQHLKETREPIPEKPGAAEKYDTEYERNGVSNALYPHGALVFFGSLEGKRHVVVTGQRTAVDWAHQIRCWGDVIHPRAARISLVMDNLIRMLGHHSIRLFRPRKPGEY